MGLIVRNGISFLTMAVMLLVIVTVGCSIPKSKPKPNPADRVSGETFYTDCCNPGLNAGDKEMCDMAAEDEDHILWDDAGNKYVFVWSDCKIGEEPWRKWD